MPTETTGRTRREVAALTGRHYDTVRRDERNGVYPNARKRPDGTVEIPDSDLEAAGHYTPTAEEAPEETIARVRGDREAAELRSELARAQERLEALETHLVEVRGEREFLRRLVEHGRAA